MVLSDRTIREEIAAGRLIIDPFDDALVQPSSIDLRVANEFRVFRNHTQAFIDPAEPEDNLTELVTVNDDQPFVLHPGEFVLGSTLERVAIADARLAYFTPHGARVNPARLVRGLADAVERLQEPGVGGAGELHERHDEERGVQQPAARN
jgi:deoxycytidine triphosphate deaminase